MARFHTYDALLELADLSDELVGGIKQQLMYYRASVYKDETAKYIRHKVEQLCLLAETIGSDDLQESVKDYQAMDALSHNGNSLHSCSFTTRVNHFIQSYSQAIESIRVSISQPGEIEKYPLKNNLQKNRKRLMSMCRHGSRHWSFFRSIV